MSKIEFVKLIGTYPGGGDFVMGEYSLVSEKEIIRLHLQSLDNGPDYRGMGEASRDEMKPPYDFQKSKKDQEEFFRGKGKEIIIETVNRVGGIEGIRRLGYGRIPNEYVSRSNLTTIIIKNIKNLTAEE